MQPRAVWKSSRTQRCTSSTPPPFLLSLANYPSLLEVLTLGSDHLFHSSRTPLAFNTPSWQNVSLKNSGKLCRCPRHRGTGPKRMGTG